MKLRATLSFGLGFATMLTLSTASSVAGASAGLKAGAVTPTTGTTATVFLFSVHFQPGSETAISASVSVAGGSVALTRTGGPDNNQMWSGSSTLPAGSWSVVFHSVSSGGSNPSFTLGSPVVVTGPTPSPTPTPAPTPPPTATPRPSPIATPRPTATGTPTATPKPTAKPTLRPTGAPQTGTPAPTPFGTIIDDPSLTPGESQDTATAGSGTASASSSPGAADPAKGGRPFNVPMEGIVAIGLLGAVTVAAALGEWRRRHAVEVFRAGLGASAGRPTAALQADAPEDAADLVNDETVAIIDYEGPDPGPDD